MPEITENNLIDIPLGELVYAVVRVDDKKIPVCGIAEGHDGFYANGVHYPARRSVHGRKIKPGDLYIGD